MQCFTLDLAQDGLGKLTAYIQTPSPELSNMNRRPAVLIFPGGAYQRCSDREAEPVALSFSAQGFQTFVLRYSVKEKAKFPQPLLNAPSVRCAPTPMNGTLTRTASRSAVFLREGTSQPALRL